MTDAPAGTAPAAPATALISRRFRGFLPVVIDFETGGFNCRTDALLEMAAVPLVMDPDGTLRRGETVHCHVKPFEGANLEPAALQVTGIDPWHPLRPAMPEKDALAYLFKPVRDAMKAADCKRAVLVAHNAHFDLGFLNEAIARTGIKRSPFHPFSVLDTATLCGVAFGQTVLAQAAAAAGFPWDSSRAHSAVYDAELTADLFCTIVNRFQPLYAAALPVPPAAEPAG
ncbi:MAG: ribonuclease T [Gammaproteobacteria bacterium]|nr:ribonuclease T [Gammaproteobacteria bacterium]